MLSLQEISDRLEIQDLMVRYSHAVDTKQWDLLDEVFTADAHIDYTAMGGPVGDLESKRIKRRIEEKSYTFVAPAAPGLG